jgi:hypothetical protein
MPSPFPGMDPYLEEPTMWSDLHLTLIVAMRAELNAHLPKGYIAAADRHVWIENPDGDSSRVVEPDVYVTETRRASKGSSSGQLAIANSPQTVTLPIRDRKGKPYLKIIDAQDRRVVTAIELLSPSNKTLGDDRNAYLAKREEYLSAGVNFVEINLLRAGQLPPLGKPRLSKELYYYLVCRAKEIPKGKLWTFTVRDPLPEVLVPLREKQAISLNLRACLDRAYQEARYDEEIDYAQPPHPKLRDDDAVWAEQLLIHYHDNE